jgi:DNA polymerase V
MTDGYLEATIVLNKAKIKNPSTTFYGRVKGGSMTSVGVFPKDILVIEIALEPRNEDIIICYIEGNFTLKQVKKAPDGLWIISENNCNEPILITKDVQFLIWGVVTHVI